MLRHKKNTPNPARSVCVHVCARAHTAFFVFRNMINVQLLNQINATSDVLGLLNHNLVSVLHF